MLRFYDNKEEIRNELIKIKNDSNISKGRGKNACAYWNLPCSFDIETSSFRTEEDEKRGITYIWQMGFLTMNEIELTVYGRTWEEWRDFLDTLIDVFNLSEDLCLLIYIHNIAFEFQWICKKFNWVAQVNIEQRVPLYARSDGFEFRCSYVLSGKNLASLAKELGMKKMVGDLDYDLIRTPLTELSDTELGYCQEDVRIVCYYIKKMISLYGTISNVPMTKTGKTRRKIREKCLFKLGRDGKKKYFDKSYASMIRNLQPKSLQELGLWIDAYSGGFTHSNPLHTNTVEKNVYHIDFTSSYPAVMVSSNHFPMSSGKFISRIEDALAAMKKNLCIVGEFKFTNLRSKFNFEHYISVSKLLKGSTEDVEFANGRIVSANGICKICITDVDFKLIDMFYDYDDVELNYGYVYTPGYLPKQLVEFVLECYKYKNELKGVKGKEEEYQLRKEDLNSIYGCMVMNPIRSINEYDNEVGWEKIEIDTQKQFDEYVDDKYNWNIYIWGCYITCIARSRLLFPIVKKIQNDYIYSDTDSIFFHDPDGSNREWIAKYNEEIEEKMRKAMYHFGFDEDMYKPRGKALGIFTYEEDIKKFKTLGAKRYIMIDDNDEFSITIAGLSKKFGGEYIKNNGMFDFFNDDMFIPKEYSGKITHTYIDDISSGSVIDYNGVPYDYKETSSINLEKQDFNLSMVESFKEYIMNLMIVENREMRI